MRDLWAQLSAVFRRLRVGNRSRTSPTDQPNKPNLSVDQATDVFLPSQERFYDALVLNSPIAIATLDMESRVTSCNPAFEKLFGYPESAALNQKIDDLVASPGNLHEAVNYTRRVLEQGETIRATGQRSTSEGELIEVEIQALPVIDQGQPVGVLTLYQDNSARKQAEKNQWDMYQSFIHIMDSIDTDVYVADMDTYDILFMNQHMRDSFGGDCVGRICYEVFREAAAPCPHCTNPLLLDQEGRPTGVHIWEGQNPITGQWYKNSDQAIKWHDGRYVRLQIATNITELKEAELQLAHLATHDSLTNLPNRVYLENCLQRALPAAEQTHTHVAVIFLDLDRFKDVNDRFGHPVGDQLLKEVAKRLRNCLRAADTVARVSGDEFVVVIEGLLQPAAAKVVAEKIIGCLAQPFRVAEADVTITASLGISVYPEDGELAGTLLLQADQAMYFVKSHGKNSYRFANQGLEA